MRLAKHVRVGHKFLMKGESQTFGVAPGHIIRNKLFSMHTLLPHDLAVKLSELLMAIEPPRETEVARQLFRDDYYLIQQERAFNDSIFTRDFRWLADRFGIPIP